MRDIIDLETYPLDRPEAVAWAELVAQCQAELTKTGMFSLQGFLRPSAVAGVLDTLKPRLENDSFRHERMHNIYFAKEVAGLAADHPALAMQQTKNNTLCADQLDDTVLTQLYEWPPFATFLAAVMGMPALFVMTDPLARLNVMGYREGEALNWHFDRSEFTTTLLLQSPAAGGEFEYARDLRSADDPNHDGVAALLQGQHLTQIAPLDAGTLNVFKGRNTAHRVTPSIGQLGRIIAVFSYFDRPDVRFSVAEQEGFYGRTA